MNVAKIPSKLYYRLYEIGENTEGISSDKLIAAYSIIKSSRSNKDVKYYAYKAKNNKTVSGFSLLRAKTNLSLNSIHKYVPFLIEEGLVTFNNGDVVLLGNNKLKEKYNHNKLVPIQIGKNIIDTQYNSLSVRLHSSKRKQEAMIRKKRHRREVLVQGKDPKTLKQLKASKSYIKRFGEKIEITDKVILSNSGYAILKGGATTNAKSKGDYWKRKLKEKGLLKTKRQFDRIKKMSYVEYKQFKLHNDELVQGKYTYIRGYLVKETAALMIPINKIYTMEKTITPIPASTEDKVKPLPYLDFDFIAWCINEDVKGTRNATPCTSRS